MKLYRNIEYLLSIPKSLYCSLRLFPFNQAVKLPMFVRYNTAIRSVMGWVKVEKRLIRPGLLKVGFNRVGIFDVKYERSILEICGTIELKGSATFGLGSRICVLKSGKLIIGDNFLGQAHGVIICDNSITIGKKRINELGYPNYGYRLSSST